MKRVMAMAMIAIMLTESTTMLTGCGDSQAESLEAETAGTETAKEITAAEKTTTELSKASCFSNRKTLEFHHSGVFFCPSVFISRSGQNIIC